MIHKVIIIGSGPAGFTSAIYCARAMLMPIVITGKLLGGQLVNTTEVENFPGYWETTTGEKVMRDLRVQAERFGAELVHDSVVSIDLNDIEKNVPFTVHLENGNVYQAWSIIVATGAEPVWLNATGEKELRNRGISTCAVCDGALYKNENVVVVGGGDSAMEEALFLTRFAQTVTIIHRREELRASKIMVARAREHPKIKWKLNSTVKEWIAGDDGYLAGAILNTLHGEEKITCTGGFIAIGHRPITSFLPHKVKRNKNGYIVVDEENTFTSVEGIFACGDVTDFTYRQAITASGQGCKAAMDAERWLEHFNF